MPYLGYLCLFAYSGVQHILCCVFKLFVFVLCTLGASVSRLSIFYCLFSILSITFICPMSVVVFE